MEGIGAYFEVHVTVGGKPDPQTGYICDLASIDRAVQDTCVPAIANVFKSAGITYPQSIIDQLFEMLDKKLGGRLKGIRWNLTPTYSVLMTSDDRNRVVLRQQFDFAAAHRLHSDRLSAAENQRVFGKCNNPNGHGHNYRVEVAVAVPVVSQQARPRLVLAQLENLVMVHVINHFDHKHLNLDCDEFTQLNPSVENIAMVAHQRLAEHVRNAGGELVDITVWETEKTSCTYSSD